MMREVHLIGNAHLDSVWLWNWQEGYTEVLSTFRSALDRMKENGSYVFTCAGALYYRWVEETAPEMFQEISRRIKEGRWVIAGGWWIQPDCNLPSGESFVRQGLYAQRYFYEKFGIMAKTGYNVDSFGHHAMIPQILKGSGMDAYVYMRPGEGDEKRYPFQENVFLWEGADGSRIKAYRIPDEYSSRPFGEAAEKAEQYLEMSEKQSQPVMCFYGVGNHGGGPTRENLKALDSLLASEGGDAYVYSSPDVYFSEVSEEALPVLTGELQHHASGCYTAVMDIKRGNRLAECSLITAESFGILAKLLGVKQKLPDMKKSWETVLFNQFHDILGGCAIRSAYECAALYELGGCIAEGNCVTNEAIQAIAWNIDTLKGLLEVGGKYEFRLWHQQDRGTPVIVFNPHSFDAVFPVRFHADVEEALEDGGKKVPVQRVRAEMINEDEKYETIAVVSVPALGWKLFWLFEKAEEVQDKKEGMVSGYVLENQWTKVELEKESGAIRYFLNKESGDVLIADATSERVVDEEKCDTWAHKVFRFHDYIGSFRKPVIEVVEDGEVRAVVEVRLSYGSSSMIKSYIMYRDMPGVFIEYKGIWLEKHKMLKICFPTTMDHGRLIASIPYGCMERPEDGRDYPMQKWVALYKDGKGLGIASKSRSAYDAEDGEIRITALRSPLYADHYGDRDRYCEFTEQGEYKFMLYLDAAEEESVMLKRTAELLSQPPVTVMGGYHAGALPGEGSMIKIDHPSVMAGAIKKAEDSDDIILRCYSLSGRSLKTEIMLGDVKFEAEFAPQQIKTFRIGKEEVKEVNLLEI